MLQGDLVTFPLPDLFQWLDQGRRSGVVEIGTGEGAPFWIQVAARRIVAAARPPQQPAGLGSLAGWVHSEAPEALWPEACADRIVDLFLSSGPGRFTLADDAAGFDDGVPLDLGVGQMTLEGLRRLDEWPDLDRRYPSESALLCADGSGHPRSAGLRAVLEAARRRVSIRARCVQITMRASPCTLGDTFQLFAAHILEYFVVDPRDEGSSASELPRPLEPLLCDASLELNRLIAEITVPQHEHRGIE